MQKQTKRLILVFILLGMLFFAFYLYGNHKPKYRNTTLYQTTKKDTSTTDVSSMDTETENIVYITPSGGSYHAAEDCTSISGSQLRALSLEKAEALHKKPCKNCAVTDQ